MSAINYNDDDVAEPASVQTVALFAHKRADGGMTGWQFDCV